MTGNRRMYFLLNMKDSQVPSAMDVHCSPVFFLTRLGCDLVIYKVSYYDPCPICKKTGTSDNHPPRTNSLRNGNLYLPLFKPKNILKKRKVTTNLALLLSICFKHGPTTKTNLGGFAGAKSRKACPINLLLRKTSLPPAMLEVEAAEAQPRSPQMVVV